MRDHFSHLSIWWALNPRGASPGSEQPAAHGGREAALNARNRLFLQNESLQLLLQELRECWKLVSAEGIEASTY
jgi:hypothetical protein